jgi:hypothetical protein
MNVKVASLGVLRHSPDRGSPTLAVQSRVFQPTSTASILPDLLVRPFLWIGLHCAFVDACYGRRIFPGSPLLGDPLLSTRIGRGEVSEGSC